MSIWAISDLHLPFSKNKPMDIFAGNWENYTEKIQKNWLKNVKQEDVVLISGDFSWATYLGDTLADFSFLNSLPGIKYLSKGNHDYWFSTITKMEQFAKKHNLDSINFVQSNAHLFTENIQGTLRRIAVCGTRGFPCEEKGSRIYERELVRLKICLDKAIALLPDIIFCMLHYPPSEDFSCILRKHRVDYLVYGHLHNNFSARSTEKNHYLTSGDYLNFDPIKIL